MFVERIGRPAFLSAGTGAALLVGLALLGGPTWGQSPGSAPSTGTRRALLIGINEYQAVPSLAGSVNDIAAMQTVLTTRWGFDARNIQTLRDRAATRAGILNALTQFVREIRPNDVAYVHYSGHGSQVQDLTGDEEDGLDETLVPHDGRTSGVPDITDDELDAIFSKLRAASVLIVLDSCHSGTATRAVDIRTRSVPRDMRVDLYRQSATSTRAIVPSMQAQHVLMSGAAADQEALDGPIDGEYRGFFSYALSRSLAASAPNASPKAVFASVAREFKRIQAQFGRNSMPEPQLEGSPVLLDGPLLGAKSQTAASAPGAARLAWLEVRPESSGNVTLVNGVLLGAAPGSTWSIYGPGESTFAPGRALAVARVAGAAGKDARATLEPATARVTPASRAVMLMPATDTPRVAIRIVDMPEQRRREIEAMLRRTIQNVEVVATGERARFMIDAQADTLRLLTADGLQVLGTFDARTGHWGQAVARVVSQSANAAELLMLDNPSSPLRVMAQIAGAPPPATRDIVLASTRPAELRFRAPGEPRSSFNSLQLMISVSSDAYLTIVDVDSEGNVNLLFPNAAQRRDFIPDGRVHANQPVLIPDSLAPGNRAGFFWDYGPPAGIDTIRVFASTDIETARLIRERVRALQPAAGSQAFDGTQRIAQGFDGLRHDLAGLATRGIAVTADNTPPAADAGVAQVADWAGATLTIAIRE
jgi:uncharacterized caspase-like protein